MRSKPKPKSKPAAKQTRTVEPPAQESAGRVKPIVVGRVDLARLMGVTPNEVSKLLPEGLPALAAGKKGAKSQYDAVEVLEWWRERQAKTGSRERYFRLQGDKLEQEIWARSGELLEVEKVEQAWADIVLASRERLLSIPAAALGRRIVDKTGEDVLIQIVDEALKDLSEWKR